MSISASELSMAEVRTGLMAIVEKCKEKRKGNEDCDGYFREVDLDPSREMKMIGYLAEMIHDLTNLVMVKGEKQGGVN